MRFIADVTAALIVSVLVVAVLAFAVGGVLHSLAGVLGAWLGG